MYNNQEEKLISQELNNNGNEIREYCNRNTHRISKSNAVTGFIDREYKINPCDCKNNCSYYEE